MAALFFRPYWISYSHYTFGGWFTDEKFTKPFQLHATDTDVAKYGVSGTVSQDPTLTAEQDGTPVKADTTLYAKWVGAPVTVYAYKDRLKTAGKKETLPNVTYGSTIKASQMPTPETETGYTFIGWYNAANDREFKFEQDKITAETTLYPRYAIATYTVSFDTDGGSEVAPITVSHGGVVPAFAEGKAPTKTGYTIEGWYSDESKATPFTLGTTPVTANMTLYVEWEYSYYTVEFIVDGVNRTSLDTFVGDGAGGYKDNPQYLGYAIKTEKYLENSTWKDKTVDRRIKYGDKVPKTTPTDKDSAPDYFVFDGWYTDSGCKNAYDYNTPVTSNLKLYGKFDQAFKVSFIDADDNSEITYVKVRAGETVARPTDAPNKEGKAFTDWYVYADYLKTDKFNFSNKINQNTDVYAKYESATTYAAMFFPACTLPAGVRIGYANNTVYVVKGNPVAQPVFERKGYTLDGWYECNQSGTKITNSVPWDFSTVLTSNIYLRAEWTAEKYTVKFETNGAGTVADQILEYGGYVYTPTLKKTGYTEGDWYEDPEFKIPFDGYVTDNVTLYKKWDPIVYDVTFVDSIGNATPSQKVAYGKTVTKPSDPTAAQSVLAFVAWYTDANFTTEYDFTAPVTKSFSLYAKYLTGVDIILNVADKTYDGKAVEATATATSKDKNIADPAVKLEYKVKGAEDSTYTEIAPINVGSYVARASTAATDKLAPAKAEKEFAIYRVSPRSPLRQQGLPPPFPAQGQAFFFGAHTCFPGRTAVPSPHYGSPPQARFCKRTPHPSPGFRKSPCKAVSPEPGSDPIGSRWGGHARTA